jgi:hypothetical protein
MMTSSLSTIIDFNLLIFERSSFVLSSRGYLSGACDDALSVFFGFTWFMMGFLFLSL